ncbi:hypothetical protein NLU13_1279 [Sarocladium strictum]|uniref:Uncharacterized protein n=1 Tax=Sarocladium strictum TaxID=5046 RepID=A0AA39GQN4_SARSR|nr:hypothetical protein NLU13_1279 [Sarocladium strictum]
MTEVDETHISVRFKHGVHTIYLFVDTLAPVSEVTAELLRLLRERYPKGLTTSVDPPKTTPVPESTEIAYAVLNVPTDPTRGWKKLKIGERGEFTPLKAGMKDNGIVAIAFVDSLGDEAVFEVEWPREDEEAYEDA